VLPETMTPPARMLFSAWPRRPSTSWTNFAGGEYSAEVRSGHASLKRSNSGWTATRSMFASQ
jgi:hypothetical protein